MDDACILKKIQNSYLLRSQIRRDVTAEAPLCGRAGSAAGWTDSALAEAVPPLLVTQALPHFDCWDRLKKGMASDRRNSNTAIKKKKTTATKRQIVLYYCLKVALIH